MTNNLLLDNWLPVRRQSGARGRIAPWQLTESADPVLTLDAPRADFNGALMQFLIGLLQTAAAPREQNEWAAWLENPPSPEQLKSRFEPYLNAFEVQSFMQDFDTLEGSDFKKIAELLIDSPGEQTVKFNKDHFIKRGQIERLCPCCALTALLTLQTNAPSGGQGHRTSLRGGGPLTTLVVPDERGGLANDLWRALWLNVLETKHIEALGGGTDKPETVDIFPWLAPTRTSEKNGGTETTPLDAHPLQMYWATPRRIRLDWDNPQSGRCDLCHSESEQLLSQYRTKNYGVNYTGAWQHPLSPYSLSKTGERLPQHAQPGGIGYSHWVKLALQDSAQEPRYFSAQVVSRYRSLLADVNPQLEKSRQLQCLLSVFGYDMDNMKARCWYETTFPLYTIPADIRLEFSHCVEKLTDSAAEFAGFVRSCVKEAWFKRPGDAKGDTSYLIQSFYQHTERDFFQALEALQQHLPEQKEIIVLNAWHATLRRAAFALFDYWAARGDISQANPRRVAEARNKLHKLSYGKKIKEALQLPKKPSKKEAA